ncbi:MAG: hypothetical protein JRG70_19195 [Deltaproteobacteria bacterium]|nr:hypothetical protein [Deltaproteobacteria bacterium]
MTDGDQEIVEHSFRLCQQLLRIDTTNPPGNEREAAELVAEELSSAGLEPVMLMSSRRSRRLGSTHRSVERYTTAVFGGVARST